MSSCRNRPRVSVSPFALPLLCLFVYLDEYGLVPRLCLAALLHEGAHLAVMALLRIPAEELRLTWHGLSLRADFPSPGKEALCTLAGPVVNLLLALACFRAAPLFCLVNTGLFLYNVLPIYPLDGGRLVRLALCALFGLRTGEAISELLSVLSVLCLAGGCLWLSLHGTFRPAVLLSALFFLAKLPNISCQTPRLLLK